MTYHPVITEADLQALIHNKIEESTTLEYKAAASLSREQDKKEEITKDVSAFANATGGRLIYGIKEHDAKAKKHLPELIDPVDQTRYSKEWLEHIIGSIRPTIENIVITPVHITSGVNTFCYVVDIPQSTTAHQARDHKYYRRRNFESTPMEDYEVRDVMNRRKHPQIDARVRFDNGLRNEGIVFKVKFINQSKVIARYYRAVILLPTRTEKRFIHVDKKEEIKDNNFRFYRFTLGNGIGGPLFPESDHTVSQEILMGAAPKDDTPVEIPDIRLTIYADEMPKIEMKKDISAALRDWT